MAPSLHHPKKKGKIFGKTLISGAPAAPAGGNQNDGGESRGGTRDRRPPPTSNGWRKKPRRRIKGAFASDVRRCGSDEFRLEQANGCTQSAHVPPKKDNDHGSLLFPLLPTEVLQFNDDDSSMVNLLSANSDTTPSLPCTRTVSLDSVHEGKSTLRFMLTGNATFIASVITIMCDFVD